MYARHVAPHGYGWHKEPLAMSSRAGLARLWNSSGLRLQPQIGGLGASVALQNGSESESDTDLRREAVVSKGSRLGRLHRRLTEGWKLLLEDPTEVRAVSD